MSEKLDLDALASAMHDAAIRYANGHTVDFQHEAREFMLERASQPGSDFDPIAGADSETTVDKPCPFCGGEGYLMKDGPHHWIECSECFCETTRCQSPSGNDEAAARRAIQLWEQRYGRGSQPGSGEAEDAARWRHVYDGRYVICRWDAEAKAYVNIGGSYVARDAIDAARASLDGRREEDDA